MSYINTFKLMQSILSHNKVDAEKFLEAVDKDKIKRALSRSKEGIPLPFDCTNEPIDEEHFSKIAHSDKEMIWDIYDDIKIHQKDLEGSLQTLKRLRKKYPNVPLLYNYIGLIYTKTGQDDKYHDIVVETVRTFPNYLFGKTALCEFFINDKMYNKIPHILDKKLNIYQHHTSDTNVFHLSEVRAFYSIVSIYYANTNKMARAIYCYFLLKKIDPDHPVTKNIANEILRVEFVKLRRKMQKNSV